MNTQRPAAPACPGCHIGCRLDAYQCARGKEMHDQWTAGLPLPERRASWKRAKPTNGETGAPADKAVGASAEAGHHSSRGDCSTAQERRPAPSPTKRLMHLLAIAGTAVKKHAEKRPERLAIDTIARHEGAATRPIIGKRTQLHGDELTALLGELVGTGFVEEQPDQIAGTFYTLTQAGQAQAEEWTRERAAADAAFAAALTDEEKTQLADLITKLLAR